MRGKLIAFEAIDAAGKATQSRLLAEKLCAELISFPRYDTVIGKAILGNLRGEWSTRAGGDEMFAPDSSTNALVRQALFTIDRYDAAPHIERGLKNNKDIVVDRYWASGLIYGASDAVPSGLLDRVHHCLPQPDVWILLDVTVEESFRRRPDRLDDYERDREKMENVRSRYRELFSHRSKFMHKGACYSGKSRGERCVCDVRRWEIVNGVGTVEEVHARVMAVVQ